MASRSWNRVELIGNLTRDPELRFTPNGAAVCTFSIATNRTYVTEGERKEEVDFHKLVAWNKLAELCNQLLKKGNKVFISGRLQTRSWQAQDGTQRQTTEIVIEDMILLTPRANGEIGVSASEDVMEDIPQTSVPKPADKMDEVEKESSSAKAPEDNPSTSSGLKEEASKKKAEIKPDVTEESETSKEEVSEDEDLPF